MTSSSFLQRLLLVVISTLILRSCIGQGRLMTTHQMIYHYSKPVNLSKHIIRLHPFNADPRIKKAKIILDPNKSRFTKSTDDNLNTVWVIDPIEHTNRFMVTVNLEIDTSKFELAENMYSFSKDSKKFKYLKVENLDESTKKKFTDWSLKQAHHPTKKILGFCKLVYENFDYEERDGSGVLTPQELLKRGSGACRDLSWFLVQLLRFNGIHSRIVSGYLIKRRANSYELCLHAWVEALMGTGKWIGLDPAAGSTISGYHIPLTIGATFSDIKAVEGHLTTTCEIDFDFLMEIKLK